MYTVIILGKRTSDLMKNYRFLFKPFVDEGIIGFCNWNESGTDVKSAVPDLYNIIKGKKEWRAVILNTDSMYSDLQIPQADSQNPFDYSRCDSNSIPHESSIPTIRLTHILGGYNIPPIREFEKGFEYFDENSGKTVRIRECDLSTEELQTLSNEHTELNAIYIEKEVSKEILDSQAILTKKYSFADIRPIEIDLIATRQCAVDMEKANIIESWKNYLEMSSSTFWDDNCYPNNCRFLVYDITNADNSLFQKQLLELWLSVLTFTTNKVPASTLQAYRLYKIGVDINEEILSGILNTHLNKINAASTFVNEQLQLQPEYSFGEDDELVGRESVPVYIEIGNTENLYIDFHHIGLSKDSYEDEAVFWQSEAMQKRRNLEQYLKIPRRSVDKSANFLKKKSDSFNGKTYELDRFQLEDLNDIMSNLEYNIISSEVNSILDRKKIDKAIGEVDNAVKKTIAFRMKKLTVLIAGAVALLLSVAGCIPYLISSAKIGTNNLRFSISLTVGLLAFTSLGGLTALIIQRSALIKVMKRFNDVIRFAVNGISGYAEKFETYFTNICTFMKAQSILDGVHIKKQSELSTSGILSAHRAALKNAAARDREWIVAYDLKRIDEIAANVTSYFNINTPPIENTLYYLLTNQEENDIPINNTGDKVTSPYKFIKHFWIKRENVYAEEGIEK